MFNLQTHDLIELSLITDISGKRENVLYKLDFGNTPVSDEYAALSDKEQKLLNTIRNLIQRTIREYDGNWINYYGRWDEVMPFIPQATLGQSVKQFVSIPMIHKDRYYTDIDGTKMICYKAQPYKFLNTFLYLIFVKSTNLKVILNTKLES